MSPDVKDENVSPPPFHEVQPLGSAKLRASNNDRPILIDDGHEARYEPINDRYYDSPLRPSSRQLEPIMPLSDPRPSSRTGLRLMRDDQDLRRAASMHNMRIEQPREFVDRLHDASPQGRPYREGSPIIAERSRIIDDNYDRTPLQELRQQVRVSRTPGPVYREVYQEPQIRYEPMPAPIERIVIDQYGRRFREIIQQDMPPPISRSMSVRPGDLEPVYDNYREPRAGSVFVDAPNERRYLPDMPPPPTYRATAETPRGSGAVLSQSRETLDQSGSMRSSSMHISDRATRYPVEERNEFREPVRMTSVRPSGPQYEDSLIREPVARASSVRPVGREGNVVIDEFGRRREYLPMEQPRYRVMEAEEPRYVDSQGREVIPQRSMQRY
jgi:hypothetical protein